MRATTTTNTSSCRFDLITLFGCNIIYTITIHIYIYSNNLGPILLYMVYDIYAVVHYPRTLPVLIPPAQHSRYFSFLVIPSESRQFSKAGWGTVVFTRSDATLLQRSSNCRASSGAFRVEIIINLICLCTYTLYVLLQSPMYYIILYYIQGDPQSMFTPVFLFNSIMNSLKVLIFQKLYVPIYKRLLKDHVFKLFLFFFSFFFLQNLSSIP